jgi:hypothetical protein
MIFPIKPTEFSVFDVDGKYVLGSFSEKPPAECLSALLSKNSDLLTVFPWESLRSDMSSYELEVLFDSLKREHDDTLSVLRLARQLNMHVAEDDREFLFEAKPKYAVLGLIMFDWVKEYKENLGFIPNISLPQTCFPDWTQLVKKGAAK